MTGTVSFMPAAGVGRRRVEPRKGRLASMTPIISVRNAGGTTPGLSVVSTSAMARISASGIRSPIAIFANVWSHSPFESDGFTASCAGLGISIAIRACSS